MVDEQTLIVAVLMSPWVVLAAMHARWRLNVRHSPQQPSLMVTEAKPRPNIGVGAPGWYALNAWGAQLRDAFGETAYLVGSSALGKTWRDVDVRLMVSEESFCALFGDSEQPNFNPRWAAFSAAFSAWGTKVTGLPIDFQVQTSAHANEHYPGVRCPLGIMHHRPLAAREEVPG